MYQLFKRIITGGSLCQWDDSWSDYLEAARATYKDLLSVRKNPHSGQVEVVSYVYRIHGIRTEDGSNPLFPSGAVHNACFAIVDPLRRHVTVLYLPFIPFW